MARRTIEGTVVTPGRGAGTLFVPGPSFSETSADAGAESRSHAETEVEKFKQGVAALQADFERIADSLQAESKSAEASIFRAHAELASDEEFYTRVSRKIEQAETAAEEAVKLVADEISNMFKESGNEILAERAADIQDVAAQIHQRLTGEKATVLDRLPEGVQCLVVALPQLYPSTVLEGKGRGVAAYIVENGTSFSHAAILAEAFGTPVLRIEDLEMLREHWDSVVYVDAKEQSAILIEPSSEEKADFERAEEAVQSFDPDIAQSSPVRFWINIASPDEVSGLDCHGIAGVGLFRTETALISGRQEPPSEEEQFKLYRQLFETCDGRTVTVRVFDIGGDKPVNFMTFGHNDNPQLGLRSLRIFHYHSDLLVRQLRALARAAAGHPHIRILYPMVETPEQWDFVRELAEKAVSDVRGDIKLAHGFMIETPSTLWCLRELFSRADFASVGTNDLVQYLRGADRTSPDVAPFYQPEHPTVLRVLHRIVSRARESGKPLTLCGEMAHEEALLPLLAGLGIQDLSMPLRLVPKLAEKARGLDLESCRALADSCLKADTGQKVRQILAGWHGEELPSTSMPAGSHVDPVCGMTVAPGATPFSIDKAGRTIYFCSSACLEKFKAQEADNANND